MHVYIYIYCLWPIARTPRAAVEKCRCKNANLMLKAVLVAALRLQTYKAFFRRLCRTIAPFWICSADIQDLFLRLCLYPSLSLYVYISYKYMRM